MASNIPCEGKYCGKGLKVELSRFFPVAKGKGKEVSAALTKGLPVLKEGYHYSVSTLRPGYFYVFNDARGSWDGYFITESTQPKLLRFLANLSDKQVVVPKFLATQRYGQYDAKFFANCECNKDPQANKKADPKKLQSVIVNHQTAGAMAGAILATQGKPLTNSKHEELININTITLEGDSSKFTSVYFVYSDTEWTAENFKKVIKARSSYMQKADLQKIIKKTATDTYNSLLVKDMMGIASELSNLVQLEQSTLNRNLENNFNHWRCDIVDGLEMAIKRGAETKYYDDMLSDYDEAFTRMYPDPATRAIARSNLRLNLIAGANGIVNPKIYASRGNLDRNIEQSWAKYEKMVDRPKYLSVRKEAETKAAACNKKVAVLDEALAGILKHSQTTAYFDNSFDSTNKEHGIALAGVLGNAINNTGDLKCCSELYEKWLSQEDMNNPLWRGLCCDNKTIAEEVKKGDTYSGTASFLANNLNWKAAFGVYGKYLGGNAAQQKMIQSYIAKLSSGISGPLTKFLLNNNSPKAITRALFVLGIHAEAAVNVTEIPGMTPLKATRTIINNNLLIAEEAKKGQKLSNNAKKSINQTVVNAKAREAMTNEMMVRYEARGLKIPKTGKITGMAITQKAAVMTNQGKIIQGTHIVSTGNIKALAVHTPAGAILGMLSLIAYGMFFAGSWNELKAKASLSEKDYASFGAVCFSTVGAFAGVAAKTLDAVAAAKQLAPTMAKGLTPTFLTSQATIRTLSIGGQMLGAVGGVIVGVLDATKAYQAGKAGNLTLLFLSGASSIVGFAVVSIGMRQIFVTIRGGSPALVRGAGSVWWLIIIMIVLSLVISWLENKNEKDPLQEWLSNFNFDKGTIAKAEKALSVIFKQVDDGGDGMDPKTMKQLSEEFAKEYGYGD